jgi:hypothetical protein
MSTHRQLLTEPQNTGHLTGLQIHLVCFSPRLKHTQLAAKPGARPYHSTAFEFCPQSNLSPESDATESHRVSITIFCCSSWQLDAVLRHLAYRELGCYHDAPVLQHIRH